MKWLLQSKVLTPINSPRLRYGIAVAAVIVALAVRVYIDPHVGERHAISVFYLPVVVAAWFGGFGPALVAALAGILVADWYFIEPRQALGVHTVADAVALGTYLVVGIAVALISGTMHAARRSAEHAARLLSQQADRLEQVVRERTGELAQSHHRLRVSERMATLGTLAAGLGHDLGNLLLPMRSHLELLRREASGDSTQLSLNAVERVADHLQRLTRGLRYMARDSEQSAPSDNRVELLQWWNDVELMLRSSLPRHVHLQHRIATDMSPICIAHHELTQAVFNLVHNAGKVMQHQPRGTVTVWAQRDESDQFAIVGVSDDGPGMSDVVKRRCLDPFFTTDVTDASWGLGLALVRTIVEKSNGTLHLESELGHGATFSMHLPWAECQQQSMKRDEVQYRMSR